MKGVIVVVILAIIVIVLAIHFHARHNDCFDNAALQADCR